MGVHARIVNWLSAVDGKITFSLYRRREKKIFGDYEIPYSKNLSKERIYVLATGPSLKNDLTELLKDDVFCKSEKFCVNFFLNNDFVIDVKPKYYCVADLAFFSDVDAYGHSILEFYKRMNEIVDWDMFLYVLEVDKDKLDFARKQITNSHIKLIPITGVAYGGSERGRYESWKKGESVPMYVNVTIMAEYIALNAGFSELYLYGVDHTFFEGIGVDDDNKLYYTLSHFYGSEKKYIGSLNGKVWHVKDWLYDKYLTFVEHERLRGYADFLGAKIINCTKNSLIDSYTRLSQIEKNKKE